MKKKALKKPSSYKWVIPPQSGLTAQQRAQRTQLIQSLKAFVVENRKLIANDVTLSAKARRWLMDVDTECKLLLQALRIKGRRG